MKGMLGEKYRSVANEQGDRGSDLEYERFLNQGGVVGSSDVRVPFPPCPLSLPSSLALSLPLLLPVPVHRVCLATPSYSP
jgi:hypothetical protein